MSHTYLCRPVTVPSKQTNFIEEKKKKAPYARSLKTRGSAVFLTIVPTLFGRFAPRTTRSFPGRAKGRGQRGPASPPGQEAPSARPSRRLKAPRRSHESRSFGHLRNTTGPPLLLFLHFPEDEPVSETPNSLSVLGQASARRRRFLPQVLLASPPALPPCRRDAALPQPRGGTAEPSAASHRGAPSLRPPRAAPGSQHGRGRAAGVPAEKGSARKVSLSLPGRPQPKPIPSRPEHGRTALLTRYSPLRPPPALFAARPRSYTPRRGTGSGTPPGGAGPPPSWAGRSSASAASCLPTEPWAGRARRGGSADPDPWVAPRGRGMLQAGQLPRGVF